MSRNKPILIVQGAQWGSEGKGMVAGALCIRRNVDLAVRTGAVNAGHTVYNRGVAHKMQQLPVGWINPETRLVLGAGAYVSPEQLLKEIAEIRNAGYSKTVYVDYRAGLHLAEHTVRASSSGRHYSIGATGKGCSEAILDRIRLRGKEGQLFRDWWEQHGGHSPESQGFVFVDTAEMLNMSYDAGEQILLEGTQGTLLDLYLGPYPYTTHKQCTAAQWVVEAGLSPNLEYETILVARTYPIRVAGNSGPMPEEISWPTLACEINKKLIDSGKDNLVRPSAIAAFLDAYMSMQGAYATDNVERSERNRDALQSLPKDTQDELSKLFEYTTVTRKLRRIARLDMPSLKYSVMLNRPTSICLSFLNYEYPELWGAEVVDFTKAQTEYLNTVESCGAPIGSVTTGPCSENYLELPWRNERARDLR